MKIASFNVNSLRARVSIVLSWLEKNQPDILCLQETKAQDIDFPLADFEETDYQCVFKGQKSYNGVAIFSKHNITDAMFGFNEEPREQPRLICAQIKGIYIVNTYIPQGQSLESEKYQYKLEWFQRLKKYFSENFSPQDPIIWVGDFNIAPTPIDVFNPETREDHVCYHIAGRNAMAEVVRWGFTDIFRKHCPEPGQYTFWDYRSKVSFRQNLGWRLDHIMATESVAKKSSASYIDKEPRTMPRPSDHTPIIAEFDI